MMHKSAPLWLAAPSRFATFKRPIARIVLALLIAALLAFALSGSVATDGDAPTSMSDSAPADLYESIVAGVRGGGDYYTVTASALRVGDHPLQPFVAFRLPALALVEASMPSFASIALLYLLMMAVGYAWFLRLRPAFLRAAPLAVALLLLAGGMAAIGQADLVAFHETWAGLLIALSLALRRPEHWVEAVAVGMIALLIRETAAPYVAVMAVLALLEGNRREAIGWGTALGVFAAVLAFHAHAVSQVVHATDPALPGWAAMPGFGFFVQTLTLSTVLALVPTWLAAMLVGLALFGWTAWNDPLALRSVTILAVYAALLGLFGRTDTLYWGLMVAPAFLIGLAFVPDGLRDLLAAAAKRRRITITRVVR